MKTILVLAASLLTTSIAVTAYAEEASDWKLMKVSVQNGDRSVACEEDVETTQVLGHVNVFNLPPTRYACLKKSLQMVTVIAPQNLNAGSGQIVVAQHLIVSEVNLSLLADPASEYPAIIERKKELGLTSLYTHSPLFGDAREYFGRLLSENIYPVSCKRFVTTIAGFRNPVGTRTLECTGKVGDISIEVAFKDKNY